MAAVMTTSDAIVASLLKHGVDTVFALPGIQTYELFDALKRNSDRIKVVGARHEQTVAYMAFGYARSTGKPGVYSVVPGPGVLNTGAALCTAYGASAPVMCITGQIPSNFIGLGKGHLHELPDQLALLRGLTKWSERIEHPTQTPRLMDEAFRQMTTGRPRPVALEIPWEVFAQSAPMETLAPCPSSAPPEADPELLDKAAELLKGARNPMIMVGSGAVHAGTEIATLAGLLQAPVVSFRGGRGIVSDDHPLGFNCAEGFKRWKETDVLLGIGSRLELQWFRWPDQPAGLKIILIDIDPVQMTRLKPAIGLVGDSQQTTAQLVSRLEKQSAPRVSRAEEFTLLKSALRKETQKVQPQMAYLEAIREVLPRNGLFVEEICQAGFTSYFGFPVYEPFTFISAGHQGTLGFGFPTALGVKVAHPDKPVVALAGDGGFMFGIQDLATAVQYGINLVTVLFNNNAFGNVLRDQRRTYAGRTLGAELHNPDFLKLAESFGVAGYEAKSPKELKRVLETSLSADKPALIVVPTDAGTEVSPWEFLMPPGYRAE